MLGGVQTLWRANVPQLYVDVDREKAKALGVPLDDVFNTLVGHARHATTSTTSTSTAAPGRC